MVERIKVQVSDKISVSYFDMETGALVIPSNLNLIANEASLKNVQGTCNQAKFSLYLNKLIIKLQLLMLGLKKTILRIFL